MKFSCEEVQTAFHRLSAQTQYDILEIEERLVELGFTPSIAFTLNGNLELSVRIYEEPVVRAADFDNSARDK